MRYDDALLSQGIRQDIPFNPTTPYEEVELLLPLVDYVLAMTVNPGFAGQNWIGEANPKLGQLVADSKRYGCEAVNVRIDSLENSGPDCSYLFPLPMSSFAYGESRH